MNAFNDAWSNAHFSAPPVINAYTQEGINAIKKNFEVVCPPIYLTGYLEFQDALGKNLSEAYVGQLPAKDVLKKTEDEWAKIIGRIGRSKLKKDLDELQGRDAEARGPRLMRTDDGVHRAPGRPQTARPAPDWR